MNEAQAIGAEHFPVTLSGLVQDLLSLGVHTGMTLLVHSSLSALGWVCGGPATVILALEAVLGPEGTLVMPTHTSDNSDPAHWCNPPVPESWWEIIRAEMPPYLPDLTRTCGMGVIAETFRSQQGTRRSTHPQTSFAARGPQAERILQPHLLSSPLGEGSPLARLYELDASILLLGVGHDSNTSLHLAEERAQWPTKQKQTQGSAILGSTGREWVQFSVLALDESDFSHIGQAFEQNRSQAYATGRVAQAQAKLIRQRSLVDFATAWIGRYR